MHRHCMIAAVTRGAPGRGGRAWRRAARARAPRPGTRAAAPAHPPRSDWGGWAVAAWSCGTSPSPRARAAAPPRTCAPTSSRKCSALEMGSKDQQQDAHVTGVSRGGTRAGGRSHASATHSFCILQQSSGGRQLLHVHGRHSTMQRCPGPTAIHSPADRKRPVRHLAQHFCAASSPGTRGAPRLRTRLPAPRPTLPPGPPPAAPAHPRPPPAPPLPPQPPAQLHTLWRQPVREASCFSC